MMKPLISMRKVMQAGNVVVLYGMSSFSKQSRRHSQRAGREQRVYTMDMRVCLDELVRLSAGKESECLECHKQT